YITVAAVRPLRRVVERYVSRFQRQDLEREHGLCDVSKRDDVRQFVQRLLNNNESEYFYLHPYGYEGTPSLMSEPHCAFLVLSIAIKSELHYDTCLAAKILQLDDSFQHKLGWLTGQMYSRVGTTDWPQDEDFKVRVEDLLKGIAVWVEPSLIRKLKKK